MDATVLQPASGWLCSSVLQGGLFFIDFFAVIISMAERTLCQFYGINGAIMLTSSCTTYCGK